MIYYNKVLSLGVTWDDDSKAYVNLATGAQEDQITGDDVRLYKCSEAPEATPCGDEEAKDIIIALEQVRSLVKAQVFGTYALAAVSWLVLIIASVHVSLLVMNGGGNTALYAVIAVIMVLSAFYTKQAFNPVVHDGAGHWIRLGSGDTNMNGGCQIKKRPDWKSVLATYTLGSFGA